MTTMQIRVERGSGAVIVRAHGELDAFLADQLQSALEDAAGAESLVVDLYRVSFMDSTALGIVSRAIRAREASSARTRVVLPDGAARRIFEITTLDRILPVSPTRQFALHELDELADPDARG
jgi:anti-anti-sigma factor